jgi:hypothetical protein
MFELTTTVLVANGIALINAVLFAISGQQKKQVNYLLLQMVASVLFALQYVIVGAFTGMVMALLGAVRMLVFFFYKKKEKEVPMWALIMFMVVTVGAGILTALMAVATSEGSLVWMWILNILPIVGIILITYGQWQSSVAVMRRAIIAVEAIWFVYNGYNKLIVNVGIGIAMMTSVLIAMARDRKAGRGANDTT